MKDKKKSRRQVAGEKLSAVYAELAPSKRDLLQEMLLQHAFLFEGDPYIKWADRNECYRALSYLSLVEDVSQDAAYAWFAWAAEIEKERLSASTIREVILDFVGELVGFRFLESFQSQVHRFGGPGNTTQ